MENLLHTENNYYSKLGKFQRIKTQKSTFATISKKFSITLSIRFNNEKRAWDLKD